MNNTLKFFQSSFIVTIVGLLLAGGLGWFNYGSNQEVGGISGTLSTILLCASLSLLEISLSFDNALINATVIRRMNDKWKHRFLTWGMLIAVVGMRIALPLIIVGLVAWINPWDALLLAVQDPKKYAEIMHHAHVPVVGFGGMFLMMVALRHFFDPEKTLHWLGLIERPAAFLGRVRFIDAGIGACILGLFSYFLSQTSPNEVQSLVVAGIIGIALQVSLDSLNSFLESKNISGVGSAGRGASIALFFYLEVQDASFSLDGVIGAFAITNNLFIIAIGLGIGSMFVRSLTLWLVDNNTLRLYRYVETGAFYAIGALAATMLFDILFTVPEIAPGGLSVLIIIASFISSIRFNRQHGQ